MAGRQPRVDISLWVGHFALANKIERFIAASDFDGLAGYLRDNRVEVGNWVGAQNAGFIAAGYSLDGDGNVIGGPSAGTLKEKSPYGAHDDHPMTFTLAPGEVACVPFTDGGKVSAALPEGSSGIMAISRNKGDFPENVPGVNSIAPEGRGLLAIVDGSGQFYANFKLLPTMTSPVTVTFNIGTVPT